MALRNRAAATRAGAGGATKTVIASHDLAIFERIRVHVPQKHSRPIGIVPLHAKLLIEIAVIDFTTPPDTDRVATHETFDSRRIERFDEKLHILVKPIVVAKG